MKTRIFNLTTPKTVRRMEPERKPFYKHDDGLHISHLRSSECWQRLREAVLSEHPFCPICRHPAAEVHHVKAAAEHEELFFDQSNLVGLCEECHEKLHAAQRRGITIDILFPNLLGGKTHV